jgi:hypothetical protein
VAPDAAVHFSVSKWDSGSHPRHATVWFLDVSGDAYLVELWVD